MSQRKTDAASAARDYDLFLAIDCTRRVRLVFDDAVLAEINLAG
jgi:uncharacterized protein (DUF427 family)